MRSENYAQGERIRIVSPSGTIHFKKLYYKHERKWKKSLSSIRNIYYNSAEKKAKKGEVLIFFSKILENYIKLSFQQKSCSYQNLFFSFYDIFFEKYGIFPIKINCFKIEKSYFTRIFLKQKIEFDGGKNLFCTLETFNGQFW